MIKSNAGKASIFVLTAALFAVSFLLGKSMTSVGAKDNDDDEWGRCISTQQCGTNNGTQSKVTEKNREYHWACPEGYSNNPGNSNCRKENGTTYQYTDPDFNCPNHYHYQNEGNWNQRCHRDRDASHDLAENVSPNGASCPGGYNKIGSGEDTQCRKTVTAYLYINKDKVYESCDEGWTADGSKCQKTESRSCETKDVYDGEECDQEDVDVCNNLIGNQGVLPEGMEANSDHFCSCKEGYHEVNSEGLRVAEDGLNDFTCVADETNPSPEPQPTPGDVCWNLDGFQGNIPDGYHKDTPDGACNTFQLGGAPPPSGGQGGAVLGASTGTGGQVLGAKTMAGTGSFSENLYMAIMGLGAIITTAGAKNFKKAFKEAK